MHATLASQPVEDSVWESTFMPMDPTSVYTEEDAVPSLI